MIVAASHDFVFQKTFLLFHQMIALDIIPLSLKENQNQKQQKQEDCYCLTLTYEEHWIQSVAIICALKTKIICHHIKISFWN